MIKQTAMFEAAAAFATAAGIYGVQRLHASKMLALLVVGAALPAACPSRPISWPPVTSASWSTPSSCWRCGAWSPRSSAGYGPSARAWIP